MSVDRNTDYRTNEGKDALLKEQEEEEKKKKKRIIIIIILLLLLGIGIGIALFFGLWNDPNAQKGHWDGKSEEQIRADLDAEVAEGEMNVSIANTIKFPNGSEEEGIAHIENIEANHVDQKVTIKLADTNEVVYESGAIPPGYCINTIKLNKHLDPGAYKAIATFTGYNQDTHAKQGSISAEINLLIE